MTKNSSTKITVKRPASTQIPAKKSKFSEEDRDDLSFMREGVHLEGSVLSKLKKLLHLHLDNYGSKHGIRIEGTLFFLNFLAIALFIIETHHPTGLFLTILTISEIVLISIFIIEYAVRLWVAKNKVKHFFSLYGMIDLLSILPILVHFANLSFFRIFRILRLFRMLRILRFQRIFKSKETMFGRLSDSQLIIIRLVLSVFTIVLISSGLILTVESKVNPEKVGTIWDAMYFSIVTLATVGYGDITPITPLGKIVTTLMILSGVALIPWQVGKLIKVMILEAAKTKITCPKCGLEDHDKDSFYCRLCGTKLKKRRKKGLEEEAAD